MSIPTSVPWQVVQFFLQLAITIAVGVYTWLTSRDAAARTDLAHTQRKVAELELEIAKMKAAQAHIPTQAQVTDLITSLTKATAQLEGTERRLGRIEEWLDRKRGEA